LIDIYRENLENALFKQNGKIDYNDLSSFFHNVKTNKDLNLFLEAMKRYQSHQSKLDFKLSLPLMHFLYVSSRTDKALELFMSEVALISFYLCKSILLFFVFHFLFTKENKFFHTEKVVILLMNKLYEDKRYDEMVQVYNRLYSNGQHNLSFAATELLLDALVEQVFFLISRKKNNMHINLI
jgi:hypothetical protein